MKYLLICNTSQNVMTFRYTLIRALIRLGHQVTVVANDDEYAENIKNAGASFYCTYVDQHSLNPFKILSYEKKTKKIVQRENPDVVFTFQVKANTFGVFAARKAKMRQIYAMVEGAGEAFVNGGIKWRVIRKIVCALYRRSLKRCRKVFFLNNDDKAEFLREKLVREDQCVVVNGVGVDTRKFAYVPVKKSPSFLMVARMMKSKGVTEYFEAARMVKEKYPNAYFAYLGSQYSITVDDVRQYLDDGIVEYCGTTDDVRPYYENCSVFVLPSYREGMPVSVLEAESVGRAVLATDVNGCRDAVRDGYNGFLIEPGEGCADRLAERMIYFIENAAKAESMGKRSRDMAEQIFDEKIVNAEIVRVIGADEQARTDERTAEENER